MNLIISVAIDAFEVIHYEYQSQVGRRLGIVVRCWAGKQDHGSALLQLSSLLPKFWSVDTNCEHN